MSVVQDTGGGCCVYFLHVYFLHEKERGQCNISGEQMHNKVLLLLEGMSTLLSRLHYIRRFWYNDALYYCHMIVSVRNIITPDANAGYEHDDYYVNNVSRLGKQWKGRTFYSSFLFPYWIRTGELEQVFQSLFHLTAYIHFCTPRCLVIILGERKKSESEPSNSAETERRH